MESSILKKNQTSSTDPSSHYLKTICLREWWLCKSDEEVDGKSLAVAGFTSTGQQAMRVFSSSPIIKRNDVFTVETSDGICIVINGFINKLRTCVNGFSSEIFKNFLFGFPPNWHEYAASCSGSTKDTAVDKDDISCSESRDKMNIGSSGMNSCSPTIVPSNVGSRFPTSQNECHLNIMQIPVNINNAVNIEGNSPHNKSGRPYKSKLKTQKEYQKESLRSKFSAEDKEDNEHNSAEDKEDNMHNSAGDAHKNPDEKKLKKASSIRTKMKKKNPEEDECYGPKRKLKFDIPASPVNLVDSFPEVISPGSMSLKRSRSGRLLMPSLDFWRNQMALYDKSGQVTAIQDGPSVVVFSRGCKSKTRYKSKASY